MSEWKEYKLGEIASFKTGKLNSNVAVNNGVYPFFTCSPETLRINDFAFDQEAILLAGNNAEGNFNIKYYIGKFNAYQRTYIISGNEGIDNKFLFYALSICLKHFKAYSQGTATKFLTAGILNNFRLSIPKTLLLQRRIASILSSLDDKIANNRRICENLEAQAQALFKHWFIDFAPFKNGKFIESELGMIPEGWRVGTLFDVAEIHDKIRRPLSSMQRLSMDKIYPYYGATELMDYVDSYLFDGDYILMGEDGSVVHEDGTPFIQYVSGKFWVNNHAHVLTGSNGFKTETLIPFLNKYNIKGLVTGAVQAKLNQANMSKILIAIPPKNVLEKVNQIIGTVYSLVKEKNQESSRLATLRDTLLPKLMSGQIKI